jgi:hypothetical protein
MMNHATTELFFDRMRIPAESLIGEEGRGCRYVLDGMSAERILIAAECRGDATWFVRRAIDYAKPRRAFDRPTGQNQGVQFPSARGRRDAGPRASPSSSTRRCCSPVSPAPTRSAVARSRTSTRAACGPHSSRRCRSASKGGIPGGVRLQTRDAGGRTCMTAAVRWR